LPWRRLAEIIGREANYRAGGREMEGRMSLSIFMTALRYNLFLILFLSIVSVLVGLVALEGMEGALLAMVMLFLLEIMIGVISMAMSLQTIISDGLLNPLQHLPISEDELRKALSLLGIYWGGLALPFIMLPAGLLSSIILRDPSLLLGFSSASIFAMILSIALGYLAGSFEGKYTRRISRRILSTLIWVLILGIGLMVSFIGDKLPELLESSTDPGALAILPPLSFLHAARSPLPLISSSLWILISLSLLRAGISRFWRAVSSSEFEAPATVTWSISFGSRALLMRELKLIVRNPRILASLLVYSLILPLSLLVPTLTGVGEPGVLPLILLAVGGLQGSLGPYYLYIVEAAGAEALYILPITRSRIASIKANSFLLMTAPISLAIMIVELYLYGAPHGVIASALYASTLLGSTHLNSLAYAHMLPKEPAHWSVETFTRWVYGALTIMEILFYISPFLIALLSVSHALLLAIPYLMIIYVISLLLVRRMRKMPL